MLEDGFDLNLVLLEWLYLTRRFPILTISMDSRFCERGLELVLGDEAQPYSGLVSTETGAALSVWMPLPINIVFNNKDERDGISFPVLFISSDLDRALYNGAAVVCINDSKAYTSQNEMVRDSIVVMFRSNLR